jgi:hypothetical protein
VPLKSETTAPQIHLNKICRGTNAALLLGDLYVWLYLQSLPKVLILKPDLSLLPLVKLPTKQIARGDREDINRKRNAETVRHETGGMEEYLYCR